MAELELRSVTALADQLGLAYKRGQGAAEMAEIFAGIAGGVSAQAVDACSRTVDALGLSGGDSARASLRSCGTRIYNVVRATHPFNAGLLAVRGFAVRCMEAGAAPAGDVLLCYVRTALAALDLAATETSPSAREGLRERALSSLRRGFHVLSLSAALERAPGGDYGARRPDEDALGASVFTGGLALLQLETDRLARAAAAAATQGAASGAAPDGEVLHFAAQQWLAAMHRLAALGVRRAFRDRAAAALRRCALTLMKAQCELPLALQLLEEAHRVRLPVSSAALGDLLLIAELQVATGDRALAYGTLDRSRELRESHEAAALFAANGTLDWREVDVASAEAGEAGDEDAEHGGAFLGGAGAQDELLQRRARLPTLLHATKEAALRVRLALAEAEAYRPRLLAEVEPEQGGRFRDAVEVVFEQLDALFLLAAQWPAGDQQARGSVPDGPRGTVLLLARQCCRDACELLGFREQVVRRTYLALEQHVPWVAASGDLVSELRLEVLQRLDAADPFVTTLLEGLAASASRAGGAGASASAGSGTSISTSSTCTSPSSGCAGAQSDVAQRVCGLLWRRLELQQASGEVHGAITSATYLLEFGRGDPLLLAFARLSLAENMLARAEKRGPAAAATGDDLGLRTTAMDHVSEHCTAVLALLQPPPGAVVPAPHRAARARAVRAMFEAEINAGRPERAAALLPRLMPDASVRAVLTCAMRAASHGAAKEAVLLLKQACLSEPHWTHHLVALRLGMAGFQPTALVCGRALEYEPEPTPSELTARDVETTLGEVAADLDSLETQLEDGLRGAAPQLAACLTWLQACTWALGRGGVPDAMPAGSPPSKVLRAQAVFFGHCVMLSQLLLRLHEQGRVRQATQDGQQHQEKEQQHQQRAEAAPASLEDRLAAACIGCLACAVDTLLVLVVDGFSLASEPASAGGGALSPTTAIQLPGVESTLQLLELARSRAPKSTRGHYVVALADWVASAMRSKIVAESASSRVRDEGDDDDVSSVATEPGLTAAPATAPATAPTATATAARPAFDVGALAATATSSKLAQLGLFFHVLGRRDQSRALFVAALQRELGAARPDGALVGRALVMLIKLGGEQAEALLWVEQALQLQQVAKLQLLAALEAGEGLEAAESEVCALYFSPSVRGYLAAWLWNHGVALARGEREPHIPEPQRTEQAAAELRKAVALLAHCPIGHPDRAAARQMQAQLDDWLGGGDLASSTASS